MHDFISLGFFFRQETGCGLYKAFTGRKNNVLPSKVKTTRAEDLIDEKMKKLLKFHFKIEIFFYLYFHDSCPLAILV